MSDRPEWQRLLIAAVAGLVNGATSAPRLLLEHAVLTQLEIGPTDAAGEPIFGACTCERNWRPYDSVMAMRTECKHFESRTYRNGETVRKCDLDLAPDAPWRCPDDCPAYERRLADRSWSYGSLITPPTPDEPASVADGSAAAVLDEAEDVLNAVGDKVRAEVDAEQAVSRRNRRWWSRLFGTRDG